VDCDIALATPAHRDAVVATVVAAFAADPAFRFFFSDDATYPTYAATYSGHLFDQRVANGTVWICAGGAVAALWDRPAVPSAHPVTLDLPGDVRGRLDRYDEAVHAVLPSYPHWYLGILATRPDHAGRRLGRRLMAAGVTSAHADGLPAVLETMSPSNVELYLRAGWTLHGQTAADGVPTTWVLANQPAAARDPDRAARAAA
jgi:GNAT superfamily N-acetyltransferase